MLVLLLDVDILSQNLKAPKICVKIQSTMLIPSDRRSRLLGRSGVAYAQVPFVACKLRGQQVKHCNNSRAAIIALASERKALGQVDKW